MLPVLITIDTEYSEDFYARGVARDCSRNFDLAIACRARGQEAGIHYQMDVMARHGIRGVFFVDPMPALVWGQEAVDRVVQPILEHGHEVQLHLHTEWLRFAKENPLGDRTGRNMRDFTREEQRILVAYAADRLVAAGAAFPRAFRAGNYGADDNTLRALSDCGILYDSSFPAGLQDTECSIVQAIGACAPFRQNNVVEMPIAAIAARNGGVRHGQVAALSAREMQAAITHAHAHKWPAMVLVSHSFELFDRHNARPLRLMKRRFEALCAWLGRSSIATGTGFEGLTAEPDGRALPLMPHNPVRTLHRMAKQAMINWGYGAKSLRPAPGGAGRNVDGQAEKDRTLSGKLRYPAMFVFDRAALNTNEFLAEFLCKLAGAA
ncbi:hypothetical protein NT2_02_03420 [Caenibius tardaugens NBRC 16725]|uniref:Polysaccharide deacetylase n=1 Tax=Caenibius tardaugens NBRC 16725 TaxID=1219035 RepID=U2YIS7_9SPHN|nr:hypothetical protein [Caenibius tardaugens]AZI34742.1 hypothetical protein EGO55_01245 [Caenibius tardaugens NBRC 16725]GAD48260.1 hypothetical protein NT2_02_03420 [Caenibius tardaugens NBRC 16725]